MTVFQIVSLGTNDHVLVGMCQATSLNQCLHLMIRNYLPYFAFYSNDCVGRTAVSIGHWHHFAFTYDYAIQTQYLYLDGVLECTHGSASPFQATAGGITIGSINYPGLQLSSFWTGSIDQISYVSRAKNASEILDDATLVTYYSFDGGSFYDAGPNKINGVDDSGQF